MFSEKNNSVLITKLFGIFVYMDYFDGLGYNQGNNDFGYTNKIKDEISSLEKKIEEIEQNNINNVRRIKKISNQNDNNEIQTKMTVNVNSNKIRLQRYDNLIDQIFRLQMKQFSESISGIKKNVKSNWYLVQFDPSEQIEDLNLSEEDYTHLIGFRDLFNSVSVHDLFQEKTFSY